MHAQEQIIINTANRLLASTPAAAVYLPLADGKSLYMGSPADIASMLPDQGGAAVRTKPSDLTEREEIDLLCQAENYMNATEKHSQTAPEAVAEESRMYGLVNGFIAKRFSDIGAAVRGEAVELTDAQIGNFWTDRDCIEAIRAGDVVAQFVSAFRAGMKSIGVSARAADAPSEPSEPEKLDIDQSREYLVTFMEQHFTDTTFHRYIRGQIGGSGPLAGDFAWQMARALRRIEAGVVKSRAADALDSQPTDFEDRPLKARVLRNELAIIIGCKDGRTGAEKADAVLNWIEKQGQHVFVSASSQPTDGGVRNACDLDAVHAFLMGESPLEGVQFGEKHPTKAGIHWWRLNLRTALVKG